MTDASGYKQVGLFEAKTHFSALIEDAIAGKTTIITKRGKPVARLVPTDEAVRRRTRQALDGLRALRGSLRLRPDETLRDLIYEGRK